MDLHFILFYQHINKHSTYNMILPELTLLWDIEYMMDSFICRYRCGIMADVSPSGTQPLEEAGCDRILKNIRVIKYSQKDFYKQESALSPPGSNE